MSGTKDECPKCRADLRAEEIPEASREHYGGLTHFSRVIAVIDPGKDRTDSWRCPDCGHEWR